MAGFSNSSENNLLLLIFQNSNWANIGDATGLRGSTTAGSFYVALHTADPGETGDQTTSEAAYTSYARVAVARSSAGWTVSGTTPTQATNAALVTFPACTGSSATATHFSVGRASSGAGELVMFGPLTANLSISTGITPEFAVGALVCQLD